MLVDFGFAQIVPPGKNLVRAPPALQGSPFYMPWELLGVAWHFTLLERGYFYDPFAVDIWGLGLVLHHAFAACLPFRGVDPARMKSLLHWMEYRRQWNQDFPQATQLRIPASVRGIISQMLANRPEERPKVGEAQVVFSGVSQ